MSRPAKNAMMDPQAGNNRTTPMSWGDEAKARKSSPRQTIRRSPLQPDIPQQVRGFVRAQFTADAQPSGEVYLSDYIQMLTSILNGSGDMVIARDTPYGWKPPRTAEVATIAGFDQFSQTYRKTTTDAKILLLDCI